MTKCPTYLVRVYAESSREVMRQIVRDHGHRFVGEDGDIHLASELPPDSVLDAAWEAWASDGASPIPMDVATVLYIKDKRIRSEDVLTAIGRLCSQLARRFHGVQFSAFAFATMRGRGTADFTSTPFTVTAEVSTTPDLVSPLFRANPGNGACR